MKKAYIILAHKNPDQIARLVARLDDGHSTFFLHVDKHVDAKEFEQLYDLQKIVPVKRVYSEWATLGLVNAVLNAFACIAMRGEEFGHIILLSGQDYPIKSNEQIDNFLEKNSNSIFLEHFPLPALKWKPRGGMFRIDKYFAGLSLPERLFSKSLNFLGNLIPALKRKLQFPMKPFAGSQWWIINFKALQCIMAYLKTNPWYVKFHRFTFGADEVFFQMLFMNDKCGDFKFRIVNDHKRFMIWPDPAKGHPEFLTDENAEEIAGSDALFARKFDISKDRKILDRIDHQFLHQA